jgi:hypothetical protein
VSGGARPGPTGSQPFDAMTGIQTRPETGRDEGGALTRGGSGAAAAVEGGPDDVTVGVEGAAGGDAGTGVKAAGGKDQQEGRLSK